MKLTGRLPPSFEEKHLARKYRNLHFQTYRQTHYFRHPVQRLFMTQLDHIHLLIIHQTHLYQLH